MANAVFTTRVSPSYDDVPEVRYHFPKRYLKAAEATVGDWIVYYEPRRSGGRSAYFATARVSAIIPDNATTDHFYALIEDGSYLSFLSPVPFKEGEDYYESRGQRDDGGTSKGWFGWSVRQVPSDEFQRILSAGTSFQLRPYERAPLTADGFAEDAIPFEYERPMVEQTLTRPFRDQAFRRLVRDAYDNRCAITGLRLLNGGGRPEVQAAHIKAVEDRGPDSVRNGLALSGTFHWLFDRGLIAADKDFRILKANGHIPEELESLFPKSGYLRLPDDERLYPHEVFLRHHRETRFKG